MVDGERNKFLEVCSTTDEDRAAQMLFALCIADWRKGKSAACCRAATRRMLERIRGGTATPEEAARVYRAVQRLGEDSRVKANPQDSRRLYALATHYLAPEGLTNGEIARMISADKSTVCRDITAAIERLSVVLFGLAAIEWK